MCDGDRTHMALNKLLIYLNRYVRMYLTIYVFHLSDYLPNYAMYAFNFLSQERDAGRAELSSLPASSFCG